MADKGIIFSAAMVRALLDGRKTQTRRLMPQQEALRRMYSPILSATTIFNYAGEEEICRAPFTVGDRLYVRESYFQFGHWEPVEGKQTKGGRQKWGFIGVPSLVQFDEPKEGYALARSRENPLVPCWHKRLGRFMPRSLSRMWLAVTDVRVQRLQECSEADAIAEGVPEALEGADYDEIYCQTCKGIGTHGALGHGLGVIEVDCRNCETAVQRYANLWNSLHTAEGERWEDHPWVVAVSFELHQGNIDLKTTFSR